MTTMRKLTFRDLIATLIVAPTILSAGLLALPQMAIAGGQATGRNPSITCEQLGSLKLKRDSKFDWNTLDYAAFRL